MTISVAGAIAQNTAGLSDGLPVGVPKDYSWYNGMNRGTDIPPTTMSAVGGWGQIYREQGSTYWNPNATVDVANSQTWVHLKATNQWVQVQTQAGNPIEGGHFVVDFAGNAGTGMTVTQKADGTATMPVPLSGYNDHFWHIGRGSFAPGTVDGVYVQMDMKISDPNVKVVANLGADWWTTPTANYVDGFANNPGAGMSNWVELSGQYKTLAFFSGSAAEFQANPPPPVLGAVTTEPKPPVTTEPSTPPTTGTPVPTPTTPSTGTPAPTDPPTSPTAGVNLLKNGSFEATQLGSGKIGTYGQVEGWTALSGSKIELWNNALGVKATNGVNFSELDYHTGRDGFSESVKTTKGQTYTFSIDARTRPGVNPNSCGVEVVWNGKVVSAIPPGANWKTFSVDVTGTGGSDTLTIREPANQSFDGVGALVDNLRLVAKAPSVTNAASTSATKSTALSADSSLANAAVASDGAAANSATGTESTPKVDATKTAGAPIAQSTGLFGNTGLANASTSSGGTTTDPATDTAGASRADAAKATPAWAANHCFRNFESGTLGFKADTSAPESRHSGGQPDALPLFRQQLAAAFADFGAGTSPTPIHDHAAATLGQTLTQPRHA